MDQFQGLTVVASSLLVEGSQVEIVLYRQAGKEPAPLGNDRDPLPAGAVARQVGQFDPLEDDAPRRARLMPITALTKVDFPAPFEPTIETTSPSPTFAETSHSAWASP